MTSRLLLLTVLLSTASLADDGTGVCGSLGTNESRVRCMGVINGHTFEPGATGVCGSLGTNETRVDCMQAARDKTYSPTEISTCGSLGTNEGRVQCMSVSGRSTRTEPPPRSRRRDDDEDDDERVVRLTNYHQATLTRVYARSSMRSRFRSVSLRSPLTANTYLDLRIDDRAVQLCAETSDGFFLTWEVTRASTEYMVNADQTAWSTGRCKDL